MPQLGNHDQIFPPGQNLIHSGKLPGQTDRLAHIVGPRCNVESVYADGSAVWFEQRREDFDNRCLTRPIGAEQGKNTALIHLEIYAL
ncbi:hypothetical protein D3C75_883520 [compost metagenome]